MTPTKFQIKLLRFYAGHETKPLTMFSIARGFTLLWLLLLVPVGIGIYFINTGFPPIVTFVWIFVGMAIGSFARDVNRILTLYRAWPAIHEIINWDHLRELIQTHQR